MGKISQVSSKYIVYSTIEIDGVVDRPDVIGAIFGQTEGLLGVDLELRELQRSGRIGRIEVNVDTKTGKTKGEIIIPSSLDKAETSIIAAALEIIQRIGPCNAKVHVTNIEDVRISKRKYVVDRAKELLKQLMDDVMPDSQELSDEVSASVRIMEIQEFGVEKLAAGPAIDESDEIIVVEGRADVLNLLKHGFKNAIALNGSNCPKTIIELSKEKSVTLFVDGDRGGDLNIKNVLSVAEIDYITKAPDGKEVEELTQKEIHKSLRSRIAAEQMKLEIAKVDTSQKLQRNTARGIANNIANGSRPVPQQPLQPGEQPSALKNEFGQDIVMDADGQYVPVELIDKPSGEARPERTERPERSDRPERNDRNDRRPNQPGQPRPERSDRPERNDRNDRRPNNGQPNQFNRNQNPKYQNPNQQRKPDVDNHQKEIFSSMLEDLVGTKGACILDDGLNVLGKVPISELDITLKSLNSGVYAVIFDGTIDRNVVNAARNTSIQYLVGMDSKVKPNETKIKLLTVSEL